jgi:starch synthase
MTMQVLFVSGEASPFCKTGGLADVAGSLPPALARAGTDTAVILPLYGQIAAAWREKMTFRCYIYVDLAWRHEYCGLFSMEYRGVTWYFVDNERYFRRRRLYGEFDDGERFAFFSRAVVDLLPRLDHRPDVIHCNDWQTALVSVYLKDEAVRRAELRDIRTVFTIHNIEYQGWLHADAVEDLLGLDRGWWDDGTLRMDDAVNVLKGALLASDAVTTVSPTYAAELRTPEHACGLAEVIASLGGKLRGVLNGIDMDAFNPAVDRCLAERYSTRRMTGKAACKAALQKQLGLAQEPDAPLIAIVSRLVGHKGMDLVCQVADIIADEGAQWVILGQGEHGYEEFFRGLAERHGGRVAACITYSDGLARQIYAGADLFLMPSRSEPCGLSQMIAMRYGTVPIVRRTGGLNDTVRSCQVGQADGTGFLFDGYRAEELLHVVRQAMALYRGDRKGFNTVRRRGMAGDYSWDASAGAYQALYRTLRGEPPAKEVL